MSSPNIIDLHEDLLLALKEPERSGVPRQVDFAQLERNRVKLVAASGFPVPPDGDYFNPVTNDLIERDFHSYRRHCESHQNWIIVTQAVDVDRVLAGGGPHGILLHVEGLHVVPEDWSMFERWYALGWRSLGLVWNLRTPLGSGTTEPQGGLTRRGYQVIEWLQARHMIVDLAHMNANTFRDTTEIVTGPLVVSHGNAAACCPSPRNLTDDQLKRVAESDGIVGVFLSKRFVTTKPTATMDDLLCHIDHLRRVMGIDHIALGTDFGGVVSGTLPELSSVDDLPRLWDALQHRGYTSDMIERIAYRNAQRVLQEILG